MSAMLVLSALFAAHSITSVPGPEPVVTEVKEVAYGSLVTGRTEEAIVVLEERRAEEPDDPAVLINLGTAYAQTGRMGEAAETFQAAMDSKTTYQLELASGEWVESRQAARMGLKSLRGTTLAAVDR